MAAKPVGRRRALGGAILAYAFVTSGALVSVARGWGGALNVGLWAGYALGGLGLVLGRGWGRVLALLAAVGTLTSFFLLPSSEWEELFYFTTVWGFSGGPAVAILLALLLVRDQPAPGAVRAGPEPEAEPPTAAHGKRWSRPGKRGLRDIAHGAFLTLGLISGWASYIGFVCRHDDLAAAFGFGVLVPFLLPLMVAVVVGPGLSLLLWRDHRLTAATALTIVLALALGLLPEESYWLPLGIHAAASTALSLDWFVRARRRLR